MAKLQDKAQGETQPAAVQKLTDKQLGFVRDYVKLNCAAQAYRNNYNCENASLNTIRTDAYKLLQKPYVAHMVDEVRRKAAERNDVTLDKLTNELYFIIETARDAVVKAQADIESSALNSSPMLSTMRQTIMDMAKLHGLVVEKSESKNIHVDLNEILRARRQPKTIEHQNIALVEQNDS